MKCAFSKMSLAILLSMGLTACGGGGSSGNNSSNADDTAASLQLGTSGY